MRSEVTIVVYALVWLLCVVYFIVTLWATYRICDRIGWHPVWAWLLVVPLVNLVFVLVMSWQALAELRLSRWFTPLAIVPLVNVAMLLLLALALSRWPEDVETDTTAETPWRWGAR
jgi:hypothetical protein